MKKSTILARLAFSTCVLATAFGASACSSGNGRDESAGHSSQAIRDNYGCYSRTLAASVDHGVCVQSSSTGLVYVCNDGEWQPANFAWDEGCGPAYLNCYSNTLGREISPGACVKSNSDGEWHQCNTWGDWAPATSYEGPIGACTESHG